jgi:hypothetical protein
MGLMDILQHYSNPNAVVDHRVDTDFDHVTGTAPTEVFGQGLSDAFRSERTPPFGDMVSQMFERSDPHQKAGLLNNLLRSVGPGVLASLRGGLLGRLGESANAGAPQVSPEHAEQLSPEEVRDLAAQAEKHDPSVMDKVGGFYAQHPQLVKTLGSAALAVALAGMSNRMRGR